MNPSFTCIHAFTTVPSMGMIVRLCYREVHELTDAVFSNSDVSDVDS